MASESSTPATHVVLDSCCIISLYASGRLQEILDALVAQFVIADYNYDEEVLWIYEDPDRTRKTSIDLNPYVANGSLEIVSLNSEDEETTAVNFAVDLDDGEAISSAIALHRNWVLATDEKKAQRLLADLPIPPQIISTLHLVKNWVDTRNPQENEIRDVITNIRIYAQYIPPRDHPLYVWWDSYL